MCFPDLYYISCLFQSTLKDCPNSTNAPDLHFPGNSDILISSLPCPMFDTTPYCHHYTLLTREILQLFPIDKIRNYLDSVNKFVLWTILIHNTNCHLFL
jgi:hypothetical protein